MGEGYGGGGGGLTYYMTEHYCVVRRGLYNVLYIHTVLGEIIQRPTEMNC